ncbi:MAG: DoxX family protein, partial [Ktedonobacterales bacterium]
HGYPKLFGGEGKQAHPVLKTLYGKNFQASVERSGPAAFAQGLERMEVPMPELAAYAAGAAEFGGGLALALGLLMPLPAVGIVAAMAIAVLKVHWKNGLWNSKGGIEYPLSLLLVAATLGLVGAGRFSVDALLGLHLPEAPVFWLGLLAALITISVGVVMGARKPAHAPSAPSSSSTPSPQSEQRAH